VGIWASSAAQPKLADWPPHLPLDLGRESPIFRARTGRNKLLTPIGSRKPVSAAKLQDHGARMQFFEACDLVASSSPQLCEVAGQSPLHPLQ
jgi:hypothetical protein